jgi:hypothetical protein
MLPSPHPLPLLSIPTAPLPFSHTLTHTLTHAHTQKLQPKTQLIAHDKEVYDIAFACGKDVFGTVGADGSLRMFDLRWVLRVCVRVCVCCPVLLCTTLLCNTLTCTAL